MNNSELPINKLMAEINAAADNNEPMNLTIEQVKLLAKHYGDLVMIPVYIVIALKNSHTAKENRRITYRYNLFPNLDAFS